MFKTVSYTENKPKYTKHIQEYRDRLKRRPPLYKEASPLQQRGEEAPPLCKGATPLQQGDGFSVFA